MRVTARVVNAAGTHEVNVETDGAMKPVGIAPRGDRPGSSVNGGEMLFAALATCYCNDLYREAATKGVRLTRVEVEVTGDFGGRGEGVTGEFQVDTADLRASITGVARVRVAALRTGNETRDRDMRKVLDVDRFPEIRFTIGSVDTISLRVTSFRGTSRPASVFT